MYKRQRNRQAIDGSGQTARRKHETGNQRRYAPVYHKEADSCLLYTSYVRIYSGTLHLRDVIRISEKEKIKLTEMCVPTNGELYSSDTACSGAVSYTHLDVYKRQGGK